MSTDAPSYPPQPSAPGGWSSEAPATTRRRQRRRPVAIIAGLAVAAGSISGATTAVLLGGGRAATSTAASVTASSTADASSSGAATRVIAAVEPALVDVIATGEESGSSVDPWGGGATTTTEEAGTGMILTADGLVLTNAHVIAGATRIQVIEDGTTTKLTATLVGEDAAKDVALLQITGGHDLPTVTLVDSKGLLAGDSVLAIGNALDLASGGFSASSGIVSALDRSVTTSNGESLTGLVQTDAAISSGDSGGALVDSSGQVIGMNTAAASSSGENTAQDIGFAIPSAELEALIPQLEKGSIGTETFGSGTDSSSIG